MKKQRKHYTPAEKVSILRRHLVEGAPISDLCDELGLQPTVFYRWQKEFFERAKSTASNFTPRRKRALDKALTFPKEEPRTSGLPVRKGTIVAVVDEYISTLTLLSGELE
jgi:transposase